MFFFCEIIQIDRSIAPETNSFIIYSLQCIQIRLHSFKKLFIMFQSRIIDSNVIVSVDS